MACYQLIVTKGSIHDDIPGRGRGISAHGTDGLHISEGANNSV